MDTKHSQTSKLMLHYFAGTPRPDGSLITLCGQTITPVATGDACDTMNAIECPLCELAWELRDMPFPKPEQGELFS
ncbi:hypothetical protein [Bifidobacterium crudilactis]|jgi:hypothetical protein|uniref:hypothetical protein n=1 Tax=Bifidobacterium crudilactis TaxID=327277 RepID=UPI0023573243|nr:hypothetical protein [Bifidobacterium crudilactis]MCI2157422.1 hypothetical protein [Bifidobacterium crudilactis]